MLQGMRTHSLMPFLSEQVPASLATGKKKRRKKMGAVTREWLGILPGGEGKEAVGARGYIAHVTLVTYLRRHAFCKSP